MRVEQEKKTGNVESVTLEQVPMEERKSWADVAMIQAGIMICVPSLMLGGILAESMPMSQAIWSGVIGYAVIVALMIFCGIMGSDLGVPTCVVASGVFGKQGSSKLISALFMISMIGWFAVQNGVCGSAFSNLIEASTGVKIPIPVSTVVWGIIMLVTAVYGINALDKLNKHSHSCRHHTDSRRKDCIFSCSLISGKIRCIQGAGGHKTDSKYNSICKAHGRIFDSHT